MRIVRSKYLKVVPKANVLFGALTALGEYSTLEKNAIVLPMSTTNHLTQELNQITKQGRTRVLEAWYDSDVEVCDDKEQANEVDHLSLETRLEAYESYAESISLFALLLSLPRPVLKSLHWP